MDHDTNMDQNNSFRIQELENQIAHLTQASQAPSQPRTVGKKPPEYDGKEKELCATFLSHLALYFNTNPQSFPTDASKVQFAATYLRGRAFRWFEPHLYTPGDRMLHDYQYFRQQMLENLGDPDRKRSLTRKIQRLSQTSSAASYSTEFFQIASMLDWNDESLKAQFYSGLKADVKDALALLPQDPESLHDLSNMAIRLDNRIYERRGDQGKGRQNNHSRAPARNNVHMSAPQSHPTPMEIDGTSKKLTDEEKQRRKVNNLCLYCGDSGHRRDSCSKRKNNMRNLSASDFPSNANTNRKQGNAQAQA